MKKLVKVIVLILFSKGILLNAQAKEHCESPNNDLEDLFVITKCSVDIKKDDKKKNTKKRSEFSFKVRGSTVKRNQIKRKRVAALNQSNKSVSSVLVKKEKERVETLELVENLSKKVSAAEVAQSIPLSAIVHIPLFKNCKRTNRKESLQCFSESLSKHIQENLKYPREAIHSEVQGDIWVRFIINKNGEVTNVSVRGPENAEALEYQVKLVIAKLPEFSPGEYKGKKVNVKYTFPINFELGE